jgi:hypothetical protein
MLLQDQYLLQYHNPEEHLKFPFQGNLILAGISLECSKTLDCLQCHIDHWYWLFGE